jgi:hypothetical protein
MWFVTSYDCVSNRNIVYMGITYTTNMAIKKGDEPWWERFWFVPVSMCLTRICHYMIMIMMALQMLVALGGTGWRGRDCNHWDKYGHKFNNNTDNLNQDDGILVLIDK